jgi:fucose 4-O-acetylase-like acetyltransferase
VENIGKKRDVALDVAKGLAITLVVFFHVLETHVNDWSATTQLWYWAAPNYFALPLFLFISGYLVHHRPDFKSIQRRTQQLMIPYVVWSIVLFFCSSFIATGFLVHGNLFKTILYDFWTLTTSSLWFLPAILVLYLIIYFTRGKPWGLLIALFATYGLSQTPWPSTIGNINIPGTIWFITLAWFLPFFAAGYLISKYRDKLHSFRFIKWFCLIAFPVIFILGWKLNNSFVIFGWPDIFASRWDIVIAFYNFGMGMLGIGLSFALASLFTRVAVIRRPFQYLGGITLGIYCSHALFRTLGFGSGAMRVLLTTIIALTLSAALIWLLHRSRVTSFLFLGSGQKLFSRKKIITQDKPAPSTALKERKAG